jgi:hypothetical protein
VLIAAIGAWWWPHAERAVTREAAPTTQPLVCPMPPTEVEVAPPAPVQTPPAPAGAPATPAQPATSAATAAPAPPATPSALDDIMGGSIAPRTNGAPVTPTVTVGERASIVRIDDQTVRIDGKYTVRGKGTENDPFQITWEMLTSASAGVDAAAGKYVLPGRIADLRGAWVRISGYWAPPLQVFEAKEAMVMLNKWDGCCIGLPPTPFDSIEAAFATPISVKGMHVYRYGTIKGRMQVEPFAAGSFLLGFYRLEDAVMESSS